jgi:hypothetical protein
MGKQVATAAGPPGMWGFEADQAAGSVHRNPVEKLASFRLAVTFSNGAEL